MVIRPGPPPRSHSVSKPTTVSPAAAISSSIGFGSLRTEAALDLAAAARSRPRSADMIRVAIPSMVRSEIGDSSRSPTSCGTRPGPPNRRSTISKASAGGTQQQHLAVERRQA